MKRHVPCFVEKAGFESRILGTIAEYMQNVSKFDEGAMTGHVLYPKASIENQGHAIENIFLSIDTKTQGLIENPIGSDHETQIQITSLQGSIALAFLIKNIHGQDISK